MLNYCVWNSIQEHEKAQMYLFDSSRVKGFTKNLEIIGIILTMVANLWNASVDKTVWNYLKDKNWFGYFERQQQSFCSCFSSSSTEDGDEVQDIEVEEASDASKRVADASTVAPSAQRTSGLKGMHAVNDE